MTIHRRKDLADMEERRGRRVKEPAKEKEVKEKTRGAGAIPDIKVLSMAEVGATPTQCSILAKRNMATETVLRGLKTATYKLTRKRNRTRRPKDEVGRSCRESDEQKVGFYENRN